MKNSSPETIKESLLRVAASLGFDFAGVARAGISSFAGEYRNWLEKGYYADMEWMARNPERRTDPRLVLDGTQSVIVLGMNYFSRDAGTGMDRGMFAKYAVGDDYHPLLEEKLKDIDELLQLYGGRQRYYTDTGPVLERDWAGEAGLGWRGKSGLFIHPDAGSFTFLAVVLTTLELPCGTLSASRCGFCRRCMDACPTGAIVAPMQVDARKCLSYLTIENKGPIPEEYRKSIGNTIYGCDKCLNACPWNRKAVETREPALFPRKKDINLPLREYLQWTKRDFAAHFRHSPVRRIKWRGFMRNVCVAAGNTGGVEELALLLPLCGHEDPLVAEHARWATAEIQARLR